jgi:5'/3'-nucleotidase
MKSKKIVVTNDDGIHSPGLHAAVKALQGVGEVKVLAPLNQQTAMGRALSGDQEAGLETVELPLNGLKIDAYACDASPATTVRHGLRVLSPFQPDLLVSGINYGENLGVSITSSGTVGAALEGGCRGIPSIAISLETGIDDHFEYSERDWDAAGHFLRHFSELIFANGLPPDVHILKIDVPKAATPQTPWQLTRLSRNVYYTATLDSPSLNSKLKDVNITKGASPGEPPDTDIHALAVGKVVSVTPLSVDFTSRDKFSAIRSWLEGEE